MSNLIEIKKRILSIESIIKVTKVMYMISVSKLTKSKPVMLEAQKSFKDIQLTMIDLYNNCDNKVILDQFFVKNDKFHKAVNAELVVVFSSDKGLCGNINSSLFKETIKYIKTQKTKISILPIGKKAKNFFEKFLDRNQNLYSIVDLNEKFYSESMQKHYLNIISEYIVNQYNMKKYNKCSVFAFDFKNLISYNITHKNILPISFNSLMQSKESSYRKNSNDGYIDGKKFFNININDKILDIATKQYVKYFLGDSFFSTLVSIYAGRMKTMDTATKNGEDLTSFLKLKYNKTRQAMITAELSDIVSGAQAVL
jgi:F-type H+-transporting ATPase subunit gamma